MSIHLLPFTAHQFTHLTHESEPSFEKAATSSEL